MIRRKLLKITLITTIIATILTTAACGKKTADNNNTTSETKATVSAETKSIAAKELTKTELVTFNYTDADGNKYTLEGKAVATESGDAVIEVSDNNGNKVTFSGKAKTVDGKLSVSDIAVKDEGTLVKADGTEIKVTTGTTVSDAAKSDETTVSDIVASEDVKQEVETSKKEEAVIEEAKEAVTKAEEIADNTTDNNGGNSDDTIIADNSSNESSDNNQGDSGSSDNNNAGNTDSNPGSSDNNGDNSDTPANPTPDETEDKKDEAPAPAPADPEPTPTPVEPEKKAIRSCWPHLQLSNGYMGGQGELEEIGDYLLPQYVDGSLSETETKNMIMNGRLYDIYNWDVDGNQQDTIPEAKMISVEIRKWDKTQIQEMRNVLFGEWIGEVPGKASGSYVRCDKEGTPYEWYAFLITYEMP